MNFDNLEIKLELEKQLDEESRKNMFYRYAIGDFKFWFAQDVEDGNIYSVGLREQGKEFENFELYVFANEEDGGGYYPNRFFLRGRSFDMSTEVAREYVKDMEKVCVVLDKVEEFFKTSKHYELYSKFHSQEKSVDDFLKDAHERSEKADTGVAGKVDFVKE